MTIKVLLVEDHTMTRMGLHLVLEKVEDIEIIAETDDGEKSVELAKQLNPDVILMDIGLPGIDGIEATQKIKDAKLDANILIFERTKEELRAGRTLFTAINAGFDRAFTSIFDSNMTTFITCLILYMLGTSIVKGFALTLAIGVAVSMFTAITVTKNFMHLFFGAGQLKHPEWFGLKPEDIGKAYSAEDTSPRKAKLGVLD